MPTFDRTKRYVNKKGQKFGKGVWYDDSGKMMRPGESYDKDNKARTVTQYNSDGTKTTYSWEEWAKKNTKDHEMRVLLNDRKYAIPHIPEKAVTVTIDKNSPTRKNAGAKFSENLLDSIAVNAKKAGIPFSTGLGIVATESTFGKGERSVGKSLLPWLRVLESSSDSYKEKASGIDYAGVQSPTLLVSNWGQRSESPFNAYFYNSQGYLRENPRTAAYYDENFNASRNKNDKYYFEGVSPLQHAFIQYGASPSSYNPKDTSYPDKVKKNTEELTKYSPEIREYMRRNGLHGEGGRLTGHRRWDELSIGEKAEMMRVAIQSGITDLGSIREKYNEFASGGALEEPQPAGNPHDGGGYVHDVLPRLLRDAGLDVEVTSGYRRAGKAGNAGWKSWHTRHGAVDIVPRGKTTFEDIEGAIYGNPAIYNYMLSNGLGLLDETGRDASSRATMRKTGATGAHFHIGKDTIPARQFAQRMSAQRDRDMGSPSQGIPLPHPSPAFMPSDEQAFFAPLATYDQLAVPSPTPQPLVDAALESPYGHGELERQERADRLRGLGLLMDMLNPSDGGNPLLGIAGMMSGNRFGGGGKKYYYKPEDMGYFAPEVEVTPKGNHPAAPLGDGKYGVTAGLLNELGLPIYEDRELKGNQAKDRGIQATAAQRLGRYWGNSPAYGFDKVMLGTLGMGTAPIALPELASGLAAGYNWLYTPAGNDLLASMAVGTLGDKATEAATGSTWGQNMSGLTGMPEWAGDLTNPYYFLGRPLTYGVRQAWRAGDAVIGRGKHLLPKRTDSHAPAYESALNWSPESWFGTRATGSYDAEDVAALRSHVPEYHEIEKTAKANGTWLMMPDGSTWEGDPRSWVQLMSRDAQEHSPRVFFTGVDESIVNPEYHDVLWGTFGQGKYSAGKARTYAKDDNHVLTMFTNADVPTYRVDAKGRSWGSLYPGTEISTNDVVKKVHNRGYDLVEFKDVVDSGPYTFSVPNSSLYYTDGVRNPFSPQNDLVLSANLLRKSLLGNNGNFNRFSKNIYKGIIPFALGTSATAPLFQER